MAAASGSVLPSLLGFESLAVPAAVGLVLLLALLGAYRLWRARRSSGATAFMTSRFEGDAEQSLVAPSRLADELQDRLSGADSVALAELGAAGDVDPIAEADVYLSYGRDAQAEEILRDAQERMPDRLDVRVKLLEVLALRRDLPSFLSQAQDLHAMTDPSGADWRHVAAIGRAMDPDNPLFRDESQAFGGFEVSAEDPASPPLEAAALSTEAAALGPEVGAVEAEDFALELGPEQALEDRTEADDDAGTPLEKPAVQVLEVDLGEAEPVEGPPESRYLEDPPEAERSLERKLALAAEFMQIGDFEGARDLLDEVYARASGKLKGRARDLLDEME